jgi:hypothetical protein
VHARGVPFPVLGANVSLGPVRDSTLGQRVGALHRRRERASSLSSVAPLLSFRNRFALQLGRHGAPAVAAMGRPSRTSPSFRGMVRLALRLLRNPVGAKTPTPKGRIS